MSWVQSIERRSGPHPVRAWRSEMCPLGQLASTAAQRALFSPTGPAANNFTNTIQKRMQNKAGVWA